MNLKGTGTEMMHEFVIAGTGHRPDKLGGFDDVVMLRLVDMARAALLHAKPSKVISGMALGWDMALAIAAVELKIPLISAVPFRGQESKWPRRDQESYQALLDAAEEVIIVCEGEYAGWKMQRRNEWMVDRADLMLCLWDGSEGGTANCVAYANKQGVQLLNLWGSWQKYANIGQATQAKRSSIRTGL